MRSIGHLPPLAALHTLSLKAKAKQLHDIGEHARLHCPGTGVACKKLEPGALEEE